MRVRFFVVAVAIAVASVVVPWLGCVSSTLIMTTRAAESLLGSADSGLRKIECIDDDACLDKLGFDAIMALHKILDDDANGNVDVTETDDFLREELQYENGYERRHSAFHLNDKYISVKELWEVWKQSEVHNWTVEETIEWLVTNVELPQYVQTFQENAVDGCSLPRLAVNNMNYLSNILGIKDPIHKQKLALKAMDVVLFGPPKHRNYVKDVVLATSLVIAIGGCWFAYLQHKYSQQHLKKMMKDMDSLQRAEEALGNLQAELDKAKQEQENATKEKKNLEQRLQDEMSAVKRDVDLTKDPHTIEEEITKLKMAEEELRHVRDDLRRAEKQLEDHRWLPPPSLQHWLQLTHELELRNYNTKKIAAEAQLNAAKEGCEKLRKKRSTMMGAFRLAHGNSIDDVDSRILQAKASLTEVTQDLKERLHRWSQIESLCGFSVVHNPGLAYLQSVLQGSTLNGTLSHGSIISGSQDDLDDADSLSNYTPSVSAGADMESLMYRGNDLRHLRSSSTDNLKAVLEEGNVLSTMETSSLKTCFLEPERPLFVVGDSPVLERTPEPEPAAVISSSVPSKTMSSVNVPRMVKSHSQDQSSPPREVPATTHSNSEPALDMQQKKKCLGILSKGLSIPPQTSAVLDEENSTDSGSTVDIEESKEKKKRRFLPSLRRNTNKNQSS